MKHVRLLTGVLFFLFLATSLQSKNCLIADDLGVITQAATFWIGTPEKSGAMAFLRIPEGTEVKILGEEGNYYRINHKDLIGYVDSKAIRKLNSDVEEEPPTSVQRSSPKKKIAHSHSTYSGRDFYRITHRTSLRENPDSKATVLLRLPEQGRVQVLESSGKYWWRVKYKGTIGWAKAALLQRG